MSTTKNTQHPELMGGISFQRPDLLGATAVVGERKRPTRPLDVLCQAIEEHDIDGVRRGVERLAKPLSAIADRRVVEALIEANWPGAVANVLLEEGVLEHNAAIKAMRDTSRWEGLLWMCKDEAGITLAEKKVGIPLTGPGRANTNPRTISQFFIPALSAQPSLMGQVAKLDVARILRFAEGGRFGNPHKGLDWLPQGPVQADNPDYVKLVDALFDVRVAQSVWAGLDEAKIREKWATGGEFFAGKALYTENLAEIAALEHLLAQSPNARACWEAYWTCDKQRDIDTVSPITHNNRAKDIVGDDWTGDGDILGLALRTHSCWVMDALGKDGALPQALYNKLRQERHVYWFLGNLDAKQTDILDQLVRGVGLEWKDDQGRGLGHAIAAAGPGDRKILSWLRNHPQAGELLLATDHQGSTPLDLLRKGAQWQELQTEISRVSREVLMTHAKAQPRPSTRAPKRSM